MIRWLLALVRFVRWVVTCPHTSTYVQIRPYQGRGLTRCYCCVACDETLAPVVDRAPGEVVTFPPAHETLKARKQLPPAQPLPFKKAAK